MWKGRFKIFRKAIFRCYWCGGIYEVRGLASKLTVQCTVKVALKVARVREMNLREFIKDRAGKDSRAEHEQKTLNGAISNFENCKINKISL